jgi:hypothetical protein
MNFFIVGMPLKVSTGLQLFSRDVFSRFLLVSIREEVIFLDRRAGVGMHEGDINFGWFLRAGVEVEFFGDRVLEFFGANCKRGLLDGWTGVLFGVGMVETLGGLDSGSEGSAHFGSGFLVLVHE